MDTFKALRTRRAIKSFDPAHRLTDEELRALLQAIALAPTSFNMQNRHAVVVMSKEGKAKLQGACFGQEQVRDASAVFVLTGDLAAHTKTARTLRHAPEPAREALEPMILRFYQDNPVLQRDEACRSVGLAAMALMLAATSLGYESCPMVGFDPAQVSELLGLDEQHPPLMVVVVGRGTKPAKPRLGFLHLEEQASLERFGEPGPTGSPLEGEPA